MKTNKFRSLFMVAALLGSLLTAGLTKVAVAQDYRIYRVEAFSTRTFHVSYGRGETAEVAIIGDGDNDLDIYVYDSAGRLVTYNEGDADQEYVRWRASYSGKYKVKIVNRGHVWSKFAILWR